ncbi:hypothetical protein HPB47_020157 [Ixodes persulcatus]|uniref:Uncharacterized protein n=1 Tax=Ixodes persulcatus TaxID=34615 RepID=A0AC60QG75_IXOPE|nr:hypothetical protein HPB47_020157 [Ixodes persulcatus]
MYSRTQKKKLHSKQELKSSKKLTKEEELLLQDFSRNVSTKSSALFYGNAFIVSAIPIWLFWRIHQMDLYQSAIVFAVMTLLCTWLIAFAYKSVKFVLKHKVAPKREDAVSREIMKKLSDDKKMSKKEKDERILWKKNEVADYEATTFSIFYNNALFLTLIIVTSFYILRAFSPMVYPFDSRYVADISILGHPLDSNGTIQSMRGFWSKPFFV